MTAEQFYQIIQDNCIKHLGGSYMPWIALNPLTMMVYVDSLQQVTDSLKAEGMTETKPIPDHLTGMDDIIAGMDDKMRQAFYERLYTFGCRINK